jgi:hypothetical protein
MSDSSQVPITKTCAKCGELKPLDAFSPHKRMPLGRQSWCRECRAAYASQHLKEHPDVVRERMRRYHEAHPLRTPSS